MKIDPNTLLKASELPQGGVIDVPGSSEVYLSGDWRTFKPEFDHDKCIGCMLCFLYCPDNAITLDENMKIVSIDYDHCKGCGICAHECKVNAIKMVLDEKE